ncbi:MAG TPA: nitrate- and nitrite sensing domain-containing protein [Streptosporangiaceae bacterium]|nr:nitrate- and nitrite sensing domain-containing protein [Streptosporangiaceae bacterium]
MGHPEVATAKPPPAHAVRQMRLPGPGLAWRNWPVSWRLAAIVVIAVVLDGVLGGLRLAAAADSHAQFGRVTQLAVLGQQVTGLAHAMEDERDLTAGFIAAGRPAAGVPAVQQEYAATNAAATKVQQAAAGIGASFPSSTQAKVTAVLDRIKDLAGLRVAALHTELPSLPLITDYSESIADLFSLNDEIAQSSADSTLEDSVRTLGSLSRMVEDASAQRALLYAAFTENEFEPGALQDLITEQAAQVSDLTSFQASAPLAERQVFGNTVTGAPNDRALLLEQHAIQVGSPQTADLGIGGAAAPQAWYSAMSGTIGQMRQVEAGLAGSVAAQSRALQGGPERSALLTGILTGTILLLVLFATLVFARSLVQPLRRLRAGALDIATSSLPARVRELGDISDPSAHLEVQPIGVDSTDEIGQVARAFDQVHAEAVRLAGNEAILRRNVSAMFVSLSRRSQSLTERLGQMMQSASAGSAGTAGSAGQGPGGRPDFAAMEHLILRMRRNSENLLVLAGYEAVRRWSGSSSLDELVRAAVSEIEQHGRVDLDIRPGIVVAGQAASDLEHLVTELVENATKFSPRDTRVQVSGYEVTSGGVLIEIHDSGLGVSPDRLAEMNRRLDNPPMADESVLRHMGLFAVAHLAARHGVRVRLHGTPPGGLTALVWLPSGITGREEVAPRVAVPGMAGVADQQLRVGGYLRTDVRRRRPAHELLAGALPQRLAAEAPAAEAPAAPVPGGLTSAGLPSRIPQANRIRGFPDAMPRTAAPLPAPPQPAAPTRSAEAARARLGGLQRGTRRAEQRTPRAGEGADNERVIH